MAERVWTVGEALDWTVGHFEDNRVPDPRRSAEWLLSHATGLTRVELYALRERPLTPEERGAFREDIRKRREGLPLQYVTGEVPFRHVVLKVGPGVFIPRPETEVLVDVALEHLEGRGTVRATVVDLCTGSGAVAISVAKEHGGADVFATDVSETAVRFACENVKRTGVADRVRILYGDLFEPLPERLTGEVDVILANPPYVPRDHMKDLPDEVAAYEPAVALDGGLDGLRAVRSIVESAGPWLAAGGLLAMEVDETTAGEAVSVVGERFQGVFVRRDLAGRERIVAGLKEA